MNTEPRTILPDVTVDRGVPKTTSLEVARIFGKRHDNVLRDLADLLSQVSDSFGKLNFEASEYETRNNLGFTVRHPMYKLTKDGFVMLAMGYTGKPAVRFKEAYIRRFNEMEAELSRRAESARTGSGVEWFRVTLDEWIAATHGMSDMAEERKRLRLIARIEREAIRPALSLEGPARRDVNPKRLPATNTERCPPPAPTRLCITCASSRSSSRLLRCIGLR